MKNAFKASKKNLKIKFMVEKLSWNAKEALGDENIYAHLSFSKRSH